MKLSKLKAKLRDWLFADYKWITRAFVQQKICALKWKHRNCELAQHILSDLQEDIK